MAKGKESKEEKHEKAESPSKEAREEMLVKKAKGRKAGRSFGRK
jgi:hypothetical protein